MRVPTNKQNGRLRIIGGDWRGRRIEFPGLEGLRPTTDRVRETLFNWLAPRIRGAQCLDLFAGSGALGLEALSRGAGHCDFIDVAPAAVQAIRQHLGVLGATDRANVVVGDALVWNRQPGNIHYDIIFVDPPFASGLATTALLHGVNLLADDGRLYLEVARDQTPDLPSGIGILKEKTAGDVRYLLLAKVSDSD